jgi:hypothetical protein
LAGIAKGQNDLRAALKAENRGIYTDNNYRFTMRTPAFPVSAQGDGNVVAAFSGPRVAGFAANTNVVIIPAKMTLNQYRDSTYESFKQIGLKLTNEKVGKLGPNDTITQEYEGDLNGRSLQFIATAVISPRNVLVATCTATKSTFKEYEAEFRACLESLKPLDG